MKQLFKQISIAILAITVVTMALYTATDATGHRYQLSTLKGKTKIIQTGTYVKGAVDTVAYLREIGVDKIALGIQFADSVSVKNVVVRKAIHGFLIPLAAGDTLHGTFATTANTGGAICDNYTLSPLADEYWFIVTYDTTTVLQGLSTPNVQYQIEGAQ